MMEVVIGVCVWLALLIVLYIFYPEELVDEHIERMKRSL